MRIGLDARSLLTAKTGVRKYTYELANALRHLPDPPEMRLFYGFYWSNHLAGTDIRENADIHPSSLKETVSKHLPERLKRWLKKKIIHHEFAQKSIDLFHATNYTIESHEIPVVVTVHDLSHLRFPETHPVKRLRWLSDNLGKTLDHALCIMADSQFTKDELIALLGIPDEKIKVVHLGVTPNFCPRDGEPLAAGLKEFDLRPKRYLLSVGTLEPRKNILSVLRAYELLPESLQTRFPLVVVGISGWKDKEISSGIKSLVRRGKVRAPGYIPDDKLSLLYSGAAVFIYPSLYEGFGLPPLEAMASGVPTVVSNRSSLPEVVGDAGIRVDPQDIDNMTQVLMSLLQDPNALKDLSAKGIERAKDFTWEACAQRTREIYQDVLNMTGSRHK